MDLDIPTHCPIGCRCVLRFCFMCGIVVRYCCNAGIEVVPPVCHRCDEKTILKACIVCNETMYRTTDFDDKSICKRCMISYFKPCASGVCKNLIQFVTHSGQLNHHVLCWDCLYPNQPMRGRRVKAINVENFSGLFQCK